MKKLLILVFLMVLLSTAGYSQTIKTIDYTTATPTEVVKTLDPADSPLHLILEAISGIGTITASGTLVTIGTPSTKNSTTGLAVTTAAQSVPSLADRTDVWVFNHSDSAVLWVSMDSAVASAAIGVGIPVFPYGAWHDTIDDSKIIGVIGSALASATVYQTGY
jgi:hypothetical protein